MSKPISSTEHPFFIASQAAGKRKFYGHELPDDQIILDLYDALEDKIKELRIASLKLALLVEQQPSAKAAAAYSQVMHQISKR